MRPFSFFFAFFAAFFSFAVMTGTFFVSLLLFCPLLITFSPAMSHTVTPYIQCTIVVTVQKYVSPRSTDADRTTGILCEVQTPNRGDSILIPRHRDNGITSTQSGTGVPGNLDGINRTEFGKRRLQVVFQNRRRNIPNV
jgi:hypothetical protein